MWSIGELKMRGKLAMKANYWAAVLVALVLGAATRGQYGMTMRITPQNVDIDVENTNYTKEGESAPWEK